MTSPTAADYPPPRDWQTFEHLCCALMSKVSGRPFQRWGRPGQRQNGVDAWSQQADGSVVALQCKGRSRMHGRALKTVEVDAAISDADTFPHQLSELIILTTAPDNVAIHDHVIAINRQRLVDGFPRVSVWGWNTICEHIGRYEDIQREFFSYWFHRYPVTRWAIVAIASIALAALSAIVFNSYRQYLRDSENGRISAIRDCKCSPRRSKI